MKERYQSALILGYGRSGRAAERLLQSEGCATTVLAEELVSPDKLASIIDSTIYEVCIVSPGFPMSHPWMERIQARGIPLLSELELGWSRWNGKTVAVTGSNGKSTAVKWLAEILQQAGHSCVIGGNYGIPACEAVQTAPDAEWLVLEVSSFQLETVQAFRPDIALLLNLLPNHLDRHGDMESYLKIKSRIFGPPSHPCPSAILPVEWVDAVRKETGRAGPWTTFGASEPADYRFESGWIHHNEPLVDLSGTLFDSPVLGACAGAAVTAAAAEMQVPHEVVTRTAQAFKALPHRLQQVGVRDGVAYVNDSKATNLAAVAAALQAVGEGIHLIAGGISKESDYTFIKEILAERVRSVYLIGQASSAMYSAWKEVCPCVECGTLDHAFNAAGNAAGAGETVLLSPGCASFDQFSGFEERGERFIQLFNEVIQCGGDAS